MRAFCLSILSIVIPHGIPMAQVKTEEKAEKIEINGFGNLYKVSDDLYRSEQPTRKGMKELEKLGIVAILNVRNSRNDKGELKKTNLIAYRVPINAWHMSYDDLVKALKVIQQAKKPVLVHCLHGSDRTGAIVAAYRMVYEGWPKEEAIAEFLEPPFGYHEKWFPDILVLLQELDVEQLKKDIQ